MTRSLLRRGIERRRLLRAVAGRPQGDAGPAIREAQSGAATDGSGDGPSDSGSRADATERSGCANADDCDTASQDCGT